jgi:hypothetical protein
VHHAKPGVVRRHAKRCAQRDHVSPQFDHGDVGLRKMPVAELGQRTAAQADHQNAAWPRHEQRKRHHRAAIWQHQCVGPRQQHLALYIAWRKFQRAPLAACAHQRRARYVGRGDAAVFAAGHGIGRGQAPDGSSPIGSGDRRGVGGARGGGGGTENASGSGRRAV